MFSPVASDGITFLIKKRSLLAVQHLSPPRRSGGLVCPRVWEDPPPGCSSALQGSLMQGDDFPPQNLQEEMHTLPNTHSASPLTHTQSYPPPPPQLLVLPISPTSSPPRSGAASSRNSKPCLYCQRTCRHLPPLEHLVLSCWVWTENSTIGSPMNSYFRTGHKHTAL